MPETDVAAFLRSLPEFRQTPARALDDLAGRCEVWSFGEDDLVRFPDEPPDGRLWVGEGCLSAARPEQPARFIGIREEADVPLGHWIRGQTAGWYVRVGGDAWQAWSRGPVSGRIFRQAAALPLVRSLLPAVFALLFVGLGVALSSLGTRVPPWALWLLPGAGIAAAAVWASLIVLEWKRSFVALNGTSVEIRRLDLGSREFVFETVAADHVREAVYTRRGWWGWLGLVTLELETNVPGGPGSRFLFPGLPADSPLVDELGGLSKPAEGVPHRQAWAAKAGRAPVLTRPPVVGEAWFRRHWWLLAGRCLPWAGWCLLIAFVAAWAAGLWPRGAAFCAMVGAAAGLVPLGRIGWEIWDWADDRFGATASHVALYRRRPFWLGETRQEAPLDQVEQIGIRRAGLAALVLDFGSVTVRLGTADPLEFEGLAQPELARRAVLARRDAIVAQRERQAAAARFDEVADIIETWNEAQNNGYGGVKP